MNKVLVIAPHIDDEVLGVGGTMIKHIARGDQVSVVAVCDRGPLKHKQRQQAALVKDKIGYDNIFFLGLRDMLLDMCIRQIIQPLEEVYNNIAPDIVYTCHQGDVNTDHQSVFTASAVVCRIHQSNPPKKMLSYEVPSSTDQGVSVPFVPNVYSVLTADEIEQKIDAFEELLNNYGIVEMVRSGKLVIARGAKRT